MFASFGSFSEVPAGGGQTSARRLLETLTRIGFNVLTTNRHRPKARIRIVTRLEILFWAIVDPIIFAYKIFFLTRRNSMVFFIGYSGAMLPMETAIGLVGKALGFKVVFFLKGGGTKRLYETGTKKYRLLFERTISIYNEVFAEGEENVSLIKRISNTPVFYLPNYTEEGFAPIEWLKKTDVQMNIIYFGRISKEKNVLFVVEIYDLLCKKSQNLFLTIVGDGENDYVTEVEKRIEQSPNKGNITRLKKQSHDRLRLLLKEQHLFLFPSEEKREGHSNALNEAMSWGVVPIVSNNNFLPSIVGDMSLVATNMNSQTYIDIILPMINNHELWEKKSKQVFERVKNHFTQHIVEKKLKYEINQIIMT